MRKGGDLHGVFAALSHTVQAMEKALQRRGHQFVYDDRLGYVSDSTVLVVERIFIYCVNEGCIVSENVSPMTMLLWPCDSVCGCLCVCGCVVCDLTFIVAAVFFCCVCVCTSCGAGAPGTIFCFLGGVYIHTCIHTGTCSSTRVRPIWARRFVPVPLSN
jgi:hypothetical protein